MRRGAAGLRVGCAPDTFLGGAHQTCRKLIDDGAIGQPRRRHRLLHVPRPRALAPDPAFYYERGGGPMLDMGPYYITDLVNLLGPVARVAGDRRRARGRQRDDHQRAADGEMIPVEVRDPCRGDAGVRLRRGGDDRDELRRAAAPPPADRALRHRGRDGRARPQPVRRPDRDRRAGRRAGPRRSPSTPTPTATSASSASPTWRTRSATTGRIAPAATSPATCWR